MVTRRVMKGVLGGVLGTYTSRYTKFDGYWLFGFLVRDLIDLRIDLLANAESAPEKPVDKAAQLAAVTFEDQMKKANLLRSQVQEAWLVIRKPPISVRGLIDCYPCDGYNLTFSAGAVMDNGRRYEREHTVFVAPHNAKLERQSAPNS